MGTHYFNWTQLEGVAWCKWTVNSNYKKWRVPFWLIGIGEDAPTWGACTGVFGGLRNLLLVIWCLTSMREGTNCLEHFVLFQSSVECLCSYESALSSRLSRDFQTHWEKAALSAHCKRCIKGPSKKKAEEILQMDRERARLVVGALTGHGPFLAHLVKLGAVENPICRYCQEEEETGRHVVFECPAIWRQLMEHLGVAICSVPHLRPTEHFQVL